MDLKLRVAICDDEKYFREEIKRLVEQYLKEKKIIFCIDLFTSGLEFCISRNVRRRSNATWEVTKLKFAH